MSSAARRSPLELESLTGIFMDEQVKFSLTRFFGIVLKASGVLFALESNRRRPRRFCLGWRVSTRADPDLFLQDSHVLSG